MAFCEKCGAELEEGAIFCWSCGGKVNTGETDTGNRVPDGSGDRGNAVRKKTNPLFVIVPVMIVLLLAAGLILYLLVFSEKAGNRREIRRQMDRAEHYMDKLDYDRAVAAYQAILELDPNNEEALEALDEAYELWAEADPSYADKIYAEAAEYYRKLDRRSDSDTASDMLARMEGKISQTDAGKEDDDTAVDEDGETSDSDSAASWQQAYIDLITSGREADFYGLVYVDADDIPELSVHYQDREELYTYAGGKAVLAASSDYSMSYCTGKGLIITRMPSDGMDILVFFSVYRLANGSSTCVAEGHRDLEWDYLRVAGNSYEGRLEGLKDLTLDEFNTLRGAASWEVPAVYVVDPAFGGSEDVIPGKYRDDMIAELSAGISSTAGDDGWRQAYIEKLEEYRKTWSAFGIYDAHLDVYFIMLDDDGIPDMYVEPWVDEAQKAASPEGVPGGGHDEHIVVSYQNGMVYDTSIGFSGGVYLMYLPKAGVFSECSPGAHNVFVDESHMITANGFVKYDGYVDPEELLWFVESGEALTYEEAVARLR